MLDKCWFMLCQPPLWTGLLILYSSLFFYRLRLRMWNYVKNLSLVHQDAYFQFLTDLQSKLHHHYHQIHRWKISLKYPLTLHHVGLNEENKLVGCRITRYIMHNPDDHVGLHMLPKIPLKKLSGSQDILVGSYT